MEADARQALAIELISQEAVDSSAIEGELLDRASVQSSLTGQLGLSADRRKANAAEAGAAELMADLYRGYQKPLNDRLRCVCITGGGAAFPRLRFHVHDDPAIARKRLQQGLAPTVGRDGIG